MRAHDWEVGQGSPPLVPLLGASRLEEGGGGSLTDEWKKYVRWAKREAERRARA